MSLKCKIVNVHRFFYAAFVTGFVFDAIDNKMNRNLN